MSIKQPTTGDSWRQGDLVLAHSSNEGGTAKKSTNWTREADRCKHQSLKPLKHPRTHMEALLTSIRNKIIDHHASHIKFLLINIPFETVIGGQDVQLLSRPRPPEVSFDQSRTCTCAYISTRVNRLSMLVAISMWIWIWLRSLSNLLTHYKVALGILKGCCVICN